MEYELVNDSFSSLLDPIKMKGRIYVGGNNILQSIIFQNLRLSKYEINIYTSEVSYRSINSQFRFPNI